jgi:hypothetical protein
MIEVRTVCGERRITWGIEVTVAQRKELHRREAVRIVELPGSEPRLLVDTHSVLEVIVPGAVARTDPAGHGDPAEWIWSLEFAHLDQLAVAVGSYVYTGVEPQASPPNPPSVPEGGGNGDGGGGNGEDPLVGASASSGPPTSSTPPAGGSADGSSAAPGT